MKPILVVDDDADIRRFLSDLLEGEGYRVLCARDGREALDALHHARWPMLVLLDLMMPVIDGYRVLEELERDPTLRAEHAIVVMSASERLEGGVFPPADAALGKPFDLSDLLDLVEMLSSDLPGDDSAPSHHEPSHTA